MSLADLLLNEEKKEPTTWVKALLGLAIVSGIIITGALTYAPTAGDNEKSDPGNIPAGMVGGDILEYSGNSNAFDEEESVVDFDEETADHAIEDNTPEKINDLDSDGIQDDLDNCPSTLNPGQEDNDGDGAGDACDANDDADKILDLVDKCPFESETYNNYQDWDGCPDKKPVDVRIIAKGDMFDPETLVVNKGDLVRLDIVNRADCTSFSIFPLGVDKVQIPKGQTTSIEFTADKAGTFKYFCPIYCYIGADCNVCGCGSGWTICDNVEGYIVVQ